MVLFSDCLLMVLFFAGIAGAVSLEIPGNTIPFISTGNFL